MKATYQKYVLNFKRPSGTSRGILKTKETWFLMLTNGNKRGVGECGILRTLSIDDRSDYEEKLKWVCEHITIGLEKLLEKTIEFPSIQFGLEQAFLSINSESAFELFPSKFTQGIDQIPINGLVWMGDKAFMHEQIKEKLNSGYACIKMKIGAIDFETELGLLTAIRKEFSSKEIELRVDANGAFHTDEALQKLQRLSELEIHSIEQPIKQGQFQEMAYLCENSPVPIALDEELIGVFSPTKKEEVIATIQPQYIILKPSLIGGFKGGSEWIQLAEKYNVAWWITSALESNVGLNAIAQWTYTLGSKLPQGLGTGGLYTNNFESPLEIQQGNLHYTNTNKWDFKLE